MKAVQATRQGAARFTSHRIGGGKKCRGSKQQEDWDQRRRCGQGRREVDHRDLLQTCGM